MGKLVGLLAALLAALSLPSVAIAAQATTIAVHGRYFVPSDSGFKDIYGSGVLYGAELTRGVAARWDGWIEASRFARSGELTFTHEPTTMSLLRIAAGPRYRFGAGQLVPYVSAGLGFYRFSESNVIGSVEKGGLGALAKAGVLVNLGPRVRLDLGLGYSHCQMKPADSEIKLSGVEAGGGLALEF